jgi:hypothetical protein
MQTTTHIMINERNHAKQYRQKQKNINFNYRRIFLKETQHRKQATQKKTMKRMTQEQTIKKKKYQP